MSLDIAPAQSALDLPSEGPSGSADIATSTKSRLGWRTAALAPGAAAAVTGTIYAIETGANVALALLVGYCALASTAALACMWTKRPADPPPAVKPAEPSTADISAAWRLVSTLTVSDASRLWCGIEPGATATQESIAWGRALADAIKQGELAFVSKPGASEDAVAREKANPHYMTQLSRQALKDWAAQHGHAPRFLQD